MRISRLRLHDFRGWADLDLRPLTHVLLVGVPRAGRSDIVIALRRVLDPTFVRIQPSLADIRQLRVVPNPEHETGDIGSAKFEDTNPGEGDAPPAIDDEATADGRAGADGAHGVTHVTAAYGEVEVTLVDLDSELAQLCDGFLEPLGGDGQVDETGSAAPGAELGVRLGYRVTYEPLSDSLEHVVFFPVRSNLATGQYARVPTGVRRALPVVVLNEQRPLQLRAEGVLRRLVADRGADAASVAFRGLEQAVVEATDALSADPAIATTVDAVLQAGHVAGHLADKPITAAEVRFRSEDGSLSALLRSVQPALELDEAGLLTLSNHGSTTTAVLAAAEVLLLARSVDGAIIVGDDFGDGLDAAAAEHLAAVLRAQSSQVWLTTRRPEVARAFAPGELVRLSRQGARAHHLLPDPADRKAVAVRRLLHAQLLPAMTSRVVAIVEGPHDLTAYSSADRYRAATKSPLSAAGARLVSADNGFGGGTSQIPRVATLAHAMGFRVVALIDCDPVKTATTVLAEIEAACDAVVRLPAAMAVEQALVTGVDVGVLRAVAALLPEYGVTDPTIGIPNAKVPKILAQLLHSKGLHEQFLDGLVDELGSVPPVLDAALTAVAKVADASYAGALRIDLPAPTGPRPTSTK